VSGTVEATGHRGSGSQPGQRRVVEAARAPGLAGRPGLSGRWMFGAVGSSNWWRPPAEAGKEATSGEASVAEWWRQDARASAAQRLNTTQRSV
jgi:hypothetical protein